MWVLDACKGILLQTAQAHIAALTTLQRRCPKTCFSAVLMCSFHLFLKSVTFLFNHLKFCFVPDICHALSQSSRFMLGGGLISVSSSYQIPLGKLCPLVELPGFTEQGFSIPPPSCIASKKTPNNFPLVQRGRNSRHLFVLQLFFLAACLRWSPHILMSPWRAG